MNHDPSDRTKARAISYLGDLNRMFSPITLETRGENAFSVAVKFFTLLEQEIPDPEEQRRLMLGWMKAVRNRNYQSFRRSLRRLSRTENPE